MVLGFRLKARRKKKGSSSMNKKEQRVRQQWSERERDRVRAAVKPGNSCPAMSSMGLKVYLKYMHIFPLQSSVFNNLANTHTHTHI